MRGRNGPRAARETGRNIGNTAAAPAAQLPAQQDIAALLNAMQQRLESQENVMQVILNLMNIAKGDKVKCASFVLKKDARYW